MKTEREAFEAAYSAIHPITPTKMTARLIWQAACAWQREQDAKVCEAETARARWARGACNSMPTPECEIAAAIRAQGER